MIYTARERADYYTHKEQETRLKVNERSKILFEKARRAVDLRIHYYSKDMQAKYQQYVEGLHKDMCDEDQKLSTLIGYQQHYLRLAQHYEIRAGNEEKDHAGKEDYALHDRVPAQR